MNMQTMKLALALSGEMPPAKVLANFDHIGLVRSEYLFRDAEVYPTSETAGPVLRKYLEALCSIVPRVWFRTLEVTTREANALRGVEEVICDEPAR